MRKLWYAGAAIVSGFLLFAASPARADGHPAGAGSTTPPDLLPGNSVAPPFGDLLSGAGGDPLGPGHSALASAASSTGSTLTGANFAAQQAKNGLDRVRRPTNNLHMTVPLDGRRPLTRVRPRRNSPEVAPAPVPRRRSAVGLPSAGLIGPLDRDHPLDGSGGDLPGAGLLGQLPWLNGVLPNGQQQSFDSLRPTAGKTESGTDGVPLLGGLAGAGAVDGLPAVPDGGAPDVTGLPGGGMAVLAPATAADPPAGTADDGVAPAAGPANGQDTAKPTTSATTAAAGRPADPRLHEEPIDGEAGRRTFSPDGRPVAGVDQQYK